MSENTGPEVPDFEGGAGETILVVDDEAAIRRLVQRGLSRHGYEVVVAASGEEAVELYRAAERPVDLVILDLGMAGMGGRACLEELLRLDPDCRILVATGYSDGGVREEIVDGARAVITKPFSLDLMARRVREILAGGEGSK